MGSGASTQQDVASLNKVNVDNQTNSSSSNKKNKYAKEDKVRK